MCGSATQLQGCLGRDRLHVRNTANPISPENFLLLSHGLIETLETSLVNGKVLLLHIAAVNRTLSRLQLAGAFCRCLGQIHFVDLSMKRSPADAELFGRGSHVAIGRGKRLHDQFFLRLLQSERTRFSPESRSGGNTAGEPRSGSLPTCPWRLAPGDC